MIWRSFLVLALLWAFGSPARAQQDWSFTGELLAEALSYTGGIDESAFWLPNDTDPARAIYAIGVVYAPIPGAAGNLKMAAGVFGRLDSGWTLLTPVQGLIGFDPRDAVWHGAPVPMRMELTTTTLREGDPRCCPSGATRWSVDLTTGQAQGPN